MSEEELNQMSKYELIGIIKAQKFEIEQLENIRKEVREYITYWHYRNDFRINSFTTGVKEELLEILDKGSDKE